MTQLVGLALLAPDIPEEILTAEVEPAIDPVSERSLRRAVRYALRAEEMQV